MAGAWEIGVSTPFGKQRAMYKPQTSHPLPAYLDKLKRLRNSTEVHSWVAAFSRRRQPCLADSQPTGDLEGTGLPDFR